MTSLYLTDRITMMWKTLAAESSSPSSSPVTQLLQMFTAGMGYQPHSSQALHLPGSAPPHLKLSNIRRVQRDDITITET